MEKRDGRERRRGPSGEAPPSAGVCICARWRRSVGVCRGCTHFAHRSNARANDAVDRPVRSPLPLRPAQHTTDPLFSFVAVTVAVGRGGAGRGRDQRANLQKRRRTREPPAWPRNYVCTSLRPRGLRGWLRFLPVCAATTVYYASRSPCASAYLVYLFFSPSFSITSRCPVSFSPSALLAVRFCLSWAPSGENHRRRYPGCGVKCGSDFS